MIEPETLNRLVRIGADEGEMAALARTMTGQATQSDVVRSAIRAALEQLERNGLIDIVDPAVWPEFTQSRSWNEIQEIYMANEGGELKHGRIGS